jgi:hypothetical protein
MKTRGMPHRRLILLELGLALSLLLLGNTRAFAMYFGAVAPHAPLPTGAHCASMITPAWPERRPQNAAANHTVPARIDLASFYASPLTFGSGPPAADFATVDGNYRGTTDMIIRWSACKWGADENVWRAVALNESDWRQSTTGDYRNTQSKCRTRYWNGWAATLPGGSSCRDGDARCCYQSYGLFQVKVWSFNAWPYALSSTSFNADFHGAYFRACMNGDIVYMRGQVNPATGNAYPNGNTDEMMWGCVGDWFSGSWYDSGARQYIAHIRQILADKPWLRPGF